MTIFLIKYIILLREWLYVLEKNNINIKPCDLNELSLLTYDIETFEERFNISSSILISKQYKDLFKKQIKILLKNKEDFLLDTTWVIFHKNHLIGLIHFPIINNKKSEITINITLSQDSEYLKSLEDIIYIITNYLTNHRTFNTIYFESSLIDDDVLNKAMTKNYYFLYNHNLFSTTYVYKKRL